MPYSPMQKSCIKLTDSKGKSAGLMVEGSAAYMSALEASKELMDNPWIKKGGDIIDETAQKDSAPEQDKTSAIKMGHEDSPATFTGMSGGSAVHQDADLSDMANLLFSEKKITKKQAKKAKEQVLANPMAKDTLKTEKQKKVETKK